MSTKKYYISYVGFNTLFLRITVKSAKLVQYIGVSSAHSGSKVNEILKKDLPLLCESTSDFPADN